MFEIQVDVKPGQDADAVSRRLDEIIAEYVRTGPTEDEVRRAVMRALSRRVQGLEQVGGFGGKAVALAEGVLYANDPNFYRTRLEQLARVTPAQVRAAMQRWLTRPVLAIRVDPGEREAYEEAPGQGSRASFTGGGGGNGGGGGTAAVQTASPRRRAPPARDRHPRAPAGVTGALPVSISPTIERARLSNGIQVVYARRTAVPVTRVAVEFDAGIAADPANRLGTQAMMLNLLEEGTTSAQLDPARRGAGAARRDRSAPARRSIAPRSRSPR